MNSLENGILHLMKLYGHTEMACHCATKVSPYQLVYGHEAVLPWELKLGS